MYILIYYYHHCYFQIFILDCSVSKSQIDLNLNPGLSDSKALTLLTAIISALVRVNCCSPWKSQHILVAKYFLIPPRPSAFPSSCQEYQTLHLTRPTHLSLFQFCIQMSLIIIFLKWFFFKLFPGLLFLVLPYKY